MKQLNFIFSFFFAASIQLHAQTFDEILGRPTDTSVTVSILFSQQSEAYVEWGNSASNLNLSIPVVTSAAATPLVFLMNQLQPNSKYFYRTRYRTVGSSANFLMGEVHSFQTQRAKNSTFTFTVEADEHLYDRSMGSSNLYKINLANQAKDSPDFMISLGDIFGDDHNPDITTSADMNAYHKYYRQFLGKFCHSVPFFICLGNHEGENDFLLAQNPPNNIAVYATLWRKFYYPNPYPNGFYSGNTNVEGFGMGQPENYYSWEWGDALFVVLDIYRDQCDTSVKPTGWAWTLGLPQYSWFKNRLETSTAKYKFVFAHHASGQARGAGAVARLFEWGGYERNGNYTFPTKRPGWAKPIHQLMKDNGVNIFFQGHDHLFAREILDSIVYQEVPMAADSTYESGMKMFSTSYTADTLKGAGHLTVTVTPDSVKVNFIRAYLPRDTVSGIQKNGEIAFSYTIKDASNTIYTFNGNGNWNDANNWNNQLIPPSILPAGRQIIIDPIAGGQCILNASQTIAAGANIVIKSQKNFVVPGSLIIQH